MRIAVLADIHGNLPALDATLAELERLQPDQVVVDGDLINAVPFSAEVVDRVRALDWLVVRGNHEFYYLDFGTERAAADGHDLRRWGQLHWLAAHIRPDQATYLAMLPDERTFFLPGTQVLSMAHGAPGRNRVGFYNEQSEAQIAPELAGITARTFISAHTHVQVDRHIRGQAAASPDLPLGRQISYNGANEMHWHLINPGSVGLPLNGDPHAQFAMLESVPEHVEPGGWRATLHRIPYDRRPALAAYAESGMAEAGGVMTQLFYWQLVTAWPEVVLFFRWAMEHGLDPNHQIDEVFRAYVAATGRAGYVHSRDPLDKRGEG